MVFFVRCVWEPDKKNSEFTRPKHRDSQRKEWTIISSSKQKKAPSRGGGGLAGRAAPEAGKSVQGKHGPFNETPQTPPRFLPSNYEYVRVFNFSRISSPCLTRLLAQRLNVRLTSAHLSHTQ